MIAPSSTNSTNSTNSLQNTSRYLIGLCFVLLAVFDVSNLASASPADELLPASIGLTGAVAKTGRLSLEHELQCQHGPRNEAEDKFKSGKRLFSSGQPQTFVESKGLYAGRCFDFVNRTMARNSLLVVSEVGSEKKMMELGLYGPTAPMGFFFDADTDIQSQERIRAGIIKNWPLFSVVNELGPELEGSIPQEASRLVLRRNGDYLMLAQMITVELVGHPEPGTCQPNLPKIGEIWSICFYRQKLGFQ